MTAGQVLLIKLFNVILLHINNHLCVCAVYAIQLPKCTFCYALLLPCHNILLNAFK